MTRKEVEALLPDMPPQMADMIRALLVRQQTAVDLANRYCLSYRTQLSKARARFNIPVYGSPTEGRPYFTYRLMLDEESVFDREYMNIPDVAHAINTTTVCPFCGEYGNPKGCKDCRRDAEGDV